MREIFLIFTALLFVLPLYYIGLYFLFMHLKNMYTESQNKKALHPVVEKSQEIKKEIREEVREEFNPEIKGIKKALSAINYEIKSVPISVEKAVEGKWNNEKEKIEMMNQETNLRIQEFIARHQYMQYRESLSIKSLEEKIKIVIDRVLDTYMTNTYLNNPKYAKSDGSYILPEINEEVRKSDLEKIYRIFRNIASEDFIDDLAPIYKISTVEGEEFFISTYIAPMYNAAMDSIKKTYREANENNRVMEEMEKRRLEASLSESAIEKQQRVEKLMQELDSTGVKEDYLERKMKNLISLKNGSKNVVELMNVNIR